MHKTDPENAIALFKQVLALKPDSLETYYNIAYILKNQSRFYESLPYYDYVLAKKPDYVQAHIGIAQAYLATGRFKEGWQELEWHLSSPPEYTKQLRDYLEHNHWLSNKKVLLRAEWGIGDTILLARYAKLLKDRGAYVAIQLLHESLVPLFKAQPYFDQVVGPHAPRPSFHFQVPIVSLPMVFQTVITNIPTPMPYLRIDNSLIETWRTRLAGDANLKIGICWHGNIIHDEDKFMPLRYFIQLTQLPQVTLYSLQQHHGLAQLDALEDKTALHTFDAEFDAIPFFDTAALMKNLDLVITVDTSIAHLAGALGIKTWVILPAQADWRWMIDRADSPWYPTMRLFRQQKKRDWQPVIDEIIKALNLMNQMKKI